MRSARFGSSLLVVVLLALPLHAQDGDDPADADSSARPAPLLLEEPAPATPPPTATPPSSDEPEPTEAPAAAPLAPPPAPAPTPSLAVCPAGAKCVRDDVLLAALLELEGALLDGTPAGETRAALAVQRLGALKDPRAVPKLLRLSHSRAQRSVRLASLTALGELAHVDEARARLEAALHPDEPVEDAAAALPALMRAALAEDRPQPIPCPEGGTCVPDETLLDALVSLEATTREALPETLSRLGALEDPRALPTLWRWSYASDDAARHAALRGLGLQLEDPRARSRLLQVLKEDQPAEVPIVVESLAEAPGDDVTGALLAARRDTKYAESRVLLETTLEKRAPRELQVLLEEEQARLAAEAEGELPLLDWGKRGAIAGSAALAGAYGGAAASSLVADQVLPGQGCLYGCYGCGVGCASAAAVGWFALGNRTLTLSDTGLALSAGLWGAYAGGLVPLMAAGNNLNDWRHIAYAAAGGQLLGLAAGTATGFFVELDASDHLEMYNAVVIGNAAALGGLLTLATAGDERFLYGALFAGTLLGVAGGGALSPFLDFRLDETANLVATGAIGTGLGMLAGFSLSALDPSASRVAGLTLLGGSAGLVTSSALAAFDKSPSYGGSLYEVWAAATGASLGVGAGFFLDTFPAVSAASPFGTTIAGAGAVMGLAGAVSTAAFPEGISQDLGDLALQPLLVGFSLYHVTALLGTAGADSRLVVGSAFAAPALVSAAITFSAPYVDNTLGDSFMIAATMAWGAWFSSMGTWSVATRTNVPSPVWIAVTAGAMDIGFMTGVGLGLLDHFLEVDRLGWKVTYVTSVAAGTTLLLALPGSLLALGTGGLVQVPDVLLLSSLLGVVAGLATMPFIDFRIAPELWLGENVPVELPGRVQVLPTVTPLMPAAGLTESDELPLTLGVLGSF